MKIRGLNYVFGLRLIVLTIGPQLSPTVLKARGSAAYFSIDDNGNVSYSGSTEGMSKEQFKLYKGINKIIKDKKRITNILFGECFSLYNTTISVENHGGSFSLLAKDRVVKSNTTDRLFHELGHVIYQEKSSAK